MFSNYLAKKFIKDYKNVKNQKVRDSYGLLGGVIGIIINIILFIIKIFTGLFTNSISVIADAFNNLSDVFSSVITIIGFKMSAMPADEEHPFGHGRIEYLSAMIVSFMVMLVGLQFISSSFKRITSPERVNFQLIPFILIIFSILLKIWLSRFNKFMGNSINSSALKASSFDALSDVVTSSCVAFSLLISKWTSIPIDGYFGIVVSLFILYSGFSLIKETLSPLLGEAPDPILVKTLKEELLKYPYITGVHDLIIHNYGPGRGIASIHAEVPCDISVVKIHEIIDQAEKELSKELNIYLSIHMDPISNDDEEVILAKEEVINIIHHVGKIKSLHDFRIVGEGEHKNLIFDIVLDSKMKIKTEEETLVSKEIEDKIKEKHPYYNVIITVDRDFTI